MLRSLKQTFRLGLLTFGLFWMDGCSPADSPSDHTEEPPVPIAPAVRHAHHQQPEPRSEESATNQSRGERITREWAGVEFRIPTSWKETTPATTFILAEYHLEDTSKIARLTFSSTGGGVEANLQRWRGQFSRQPDDPEPRHYTISVDHVEAVVLELYGTFRDGFSSQPPQAGYAMLGIAIPTGPATFFVKLTGPRELVSKYRDEVLDVVKTARLKAP